MEQLLLLSMMLSVLLLLLMLLLLITQVRLSHLIIPQLGLHIRVITV